jgi:hypothetical protein
MPIIFVHGVATRTDDKGVYDSWWGEIKRYLETYIAPEIGASPDRIVDAYWGDLAIKFAWDGASRPLSPLLGKGPPSDPTAMEQVIAIASQPGPVRDAPASPSAPSPTNVLVPAGPAAGPSTEPSAPIRLQDLAREQLSDLAVTVLQDLIKEPDRRASAVLAADAVAHDPATLGALAACPDRPAELELFKNLIAARYAEFERSRTATTPGLVPMGGGGGWWQEFKDRVGEATERVGGVPGFVLARTLAEFRRPANDLVTMFVGDVFQYLKARLEPDKRPGPIPLRVLGKLKEARDQAPVEEPVVVLSHSMGGQIIYDLVTYFLPRALAVDRIRIDFWCATASQVGLFEEMKMFLASSKNYSAKQGNLTPYPSLSHLGGWWNVWDPNDFISYTAKPIIAEVDDESYNSGMSVLGAHGGYLQYASFYRKFAKKLKGARAQNWWRPKTGSPS